MSKTLPPKINLHEGRERRRERKGGREGGRRRKGKSLSTGTEGKESPFQWNKNCAISWRTACSDRGGRLLSRKWISVVEVFFFFFWMIKGIRAHCEPPPPACLPACLPLEGYRSWRFFYQMVFRGGNELCNHLAKAIWLCRDARSLMSPPPLLLLLALSLSLSLRHALPMGEHHPTFSQPGLRAICVLQCSPCRRLHLKRLTDGWMGLHVFLGEGFLGGCVIRGWGTERWTALQIFHYYTRVCTAPPQHIFWLLDCT